MRKTIHPLNPTLSDLFARFVSIILRIEFLILPYHLIIFLLVNKSYMYVKMSYIKLQICVGSQDFGIYVDIYVLRLLVTNENN